jgi:hypothetical protein
LKQNEIKLRKITNDVNITVDNNKLLLFLYIFLNKNIIKNYFSEGKQ